jgi:hypothetical protein
LPKSCAARHLNPSCSPISYRRLFDRILANLARRTFDQEVALDLAAESFAPAYINRSRFRGAVRRRALLVAIAAGALAIPAAVRGRRVAIGAPLAGTVPLNMDTKFRC